MEKWLYAEGKLYNTDCFQRIECCRIKAKPELWAIRAFYVINTDSERRRYVDLYTGDEEDTRQAQERLARWLHAPDIDYF